MNRQARGFLLVITITAVAASVLPAQELTDPYEILHRHYEAVGGLERMRGERTTHLRGTFSAAGLTGSIERWSERPGKSRTEVDLGAIRDTRGDNGEVIWALDRNGKLQFERDERGLVLRELALKQERFEHLDPKSDVFEVTLDRIESINGAECYVVKITNTLDDAITLQYYDTSTLLQMRESSIRGDRGSHTTFSDYREVGGVAKAFRTVTTLLPIGQQQVAEIDHYETNIPIDPSLFEPPEEGTPSYGFAGGRDSAAVKCEIHSGHIYLPVTINCDRQWWVLDSGAGATVIDTDYARSLGLELAGGGQAAGAGQAVEFRMTTLPKHFLPGLELDEQQIIAIEIADLFKRAADTEIGGILGYDFLSRFVTRIDYADSTITFYEPSTFSYEGDGTVIDAPLQSNIPTATIELDGEFAGRCMVDLGATSIHIHYPFAEQQDMLEREGVPMVSMGAGGMFDVMLSRFESVGFAGSTIDRPIVVVSIENVVGAFGATDLVATIGYDVLRHFVSYFDYDRQEIIVERGADFGKKLPQDMGGLAVWRSEGGQLEVFFVMPGTPAEAAGFEKGDVITAVNDIPTERLAGLEAVKKLLEEEAGTTYTITVIRDGQTRRLDLTLREYL